MFPHLEQLEVVFPYLRELGSLHQKHGVKRHHIDLGGVKRHHIDLGRVKRHHIDLGGVKRHHIDLGGV